MPVLLSALQARVIQRVAQSQLHFHRKVITCTNTCGNKTYTLCLSFKQQQKVRLAFCWFLQCPLNGKSSKKIRV